MSVLEIRHRSGLIETRELSKENPLLVGHLATNDICVDADDVAPIHCRISWNRKSFEVAAVGPGGVQHNGVTVGTSLLHEGDVIRVGDVDIVVLAQTQEPGALDLVSHAELKAISADALPVRSFHMSLLPEAGPGNAGDASPGAPVGAPASSSPAASRPAGPVPGGDSASPSAGDRRVGMNRMEIMLGLDDRPAPVAEPIDPDESVSAAEKIKQSLKARVRPGEQDALRSPLVIGLSVGALVLVLSALTIWFVLSREKAQRQFDAAESQLRGGQFTEAINGFEQFLRDNPRHKLAPQARAEIGTATVEQAIAGATPAWDKGLEALQKYVEDNRQSGQFQDAESPLRKFIVESSDRIASGALETARSSRKRTFLATAASAIKLIELYCPTDNRPEGRFKELAQATRAAEDAVVQQEAFDAATQKIDEALADRKSPAAFQVYRRLLAQYPAAAENRTLKDRLKKAFDLERTLAVRDETPRDSVADETGSPQRAPQRSGARAGQLTLARRNRARTDLASVGTTVFVVAEDCLYGVDSVTGEPVWRKVIGLDPPFMPVAAATGQPALLFADARSDLWLVHARTGDVVWKLPLAGRPAGQPLIHEGQIYLATEAGVLEQIDLLTGRGAARLRFSGKIAATPEVSQSGDRLYLPGHENILYVLTRRPLACEQVVWLGHGPGAILAPAMMLRDYLLLAENDGVATCRLRLFDTARPGQPLVEIAKQTIDGQVRDTPVIRGKQLFVPSANERVTAFLIAETGDDKSLARVAAYQAKNPRPTPIFITAGPDDQMWMFSSSLRRFELSRDSLTPDKQQLATGIAAQPVQSLGDSLYIARRQAYSPAVILAEAERRQMVVQWQTALGARVIECSAPAAQDGAVMCVTSLGDLFMVSPQRLARGGFDMQPLGSIPIPEGLDSALSAVRLGDGRLAVYCGGAEPRLWLPGGDGLAREQKLPQELETGPISLGGGLLLALPGRLRIIGRAATDPTVEDLPAAIGQEAPHRWKSLIALDPTQAVVLSEAGRLARLQFGTAPVPHLEEITHWDAGCAVDLPAALGERRLFLVDSTSRLVMLDANSLEPLAQTVLDASPAARPRPVGEHVVVELKTGQLAAYDVASKLQKSWELPLDGAWLAGDPLVEGGQLLVALTDGRALWVDASSGQVLRTVTLGQQLNFGPQRWGKNIVVGALDGTLLVLNPPETSGANTGEAQQ